jgi:type I restriction enzyme S subunit
MILSKLTDGTHHSPVNLPSGDFMYITAKNIKFDGISLKDITYVSKDIHNEIFSRCNPEKGDILYIKDGATTGVATINSMSNPFSMLSSVALLKPMRYLNNHYLLGFLQSPICYNFTRNNMKGVGITRVTLAQMSRWLIPIAPLQEQNRIVEKIDFAFALIGDIEADKLDLIQFVKTTKSKILDLAILGKLVPQDPNDEPASVLLERIKSEHPESKKKTKYTGDNSHYQNLPFKIPENWVWARFQDIFNIMMGQSPSSECISSDGEYEFHQGRTHFGDKILLSSQTFTSYPTKLAQSHSLLLCVRAPVGDINITNREICIGRGLCSLKPLNEISLGFAYYWVSYFKNSFINKATGTTFLAISSETIRNEFIPIPPLKEQMIITKTINSIYTMLDKITAEL